MMPQPGNELARLCLLFFNDFSINPASAWPDPHYIVCWPWFSL